MRALDQVERVESTLRLTGEYTTPYGALIREDIVMGISRYFLERWVPVLGAAPAAVVNTLRQLDFRCQGETVIISGADLAREAGMSRRHLYTCLAHPWISAFVRVESGDHIRSSSGKIAQETNRYHIRLDDPISPADADHLLTLLVGLADTPLNAAQRALELEPRSLWAEQPANSSPLFFQPGALTAYGVLQRAFPFWVPENDEQSQQFAQLSEALHRHITLVRTDGKISKIIVPQYFRKFWWTRLGHDLAWCYLWLRGNVYDNPAEGIRRDSCWIPSVNALLTIIGRPREWWRRNVENAPDSGEEWSLDEFFVQTAAKKGRDRAQPQAVARQYRVALDIPVAPEHRHRYSELLKNWSQNSKPSLPDSQAIPSNGVCPIFTHRPSAGVPHFNSPAQAGSATCQLTASEAVRHVSTQGSGSNEHRESESLIKAQNNDSESKSNSKHPESTGAAGASVESLEVQKPLIDLLAEALEAKPEVPLFQAVSLDIWFRQTWPEPIRSHTPAWRYVNSGAVSARDVLALMLAIWADPTITSPPRYLSWIMQRWQTQPDSPPIDRWDVWQSLAEMPLVDWVRIGRQRWIDATSRNSRAMPFGLDLLVDEYLMGDSAQPGPSPCPPGPDRAEEPPSAGLDEHPGGGPFSMRDIWIITLDQLRTQLNHSTFTSWVEGAKAISFAAGVLTVRARHRMARDMLSERLNHSIEATASALAKTPITVRYIAEPPLFPLIRQTIPPQNVSD